MWFFCYFFSFGWLEFFFYAPTCDVVMLMLFFSIPTFLWFMYVESLSIKTKNYQNRCKFHHCLDISVKNGICFDLKVQIFVSSGFNNGSRIQCLNICHSQTQFFFFHFQTTRSTPNGFGFKYIQFGHFIVNIEQVSLAWYCLHDFSTENKCVFFVLFCFSFNEVK